jgi:hypothetical protein
LNSGRGSILKCSNSALAQEDKKSLDGKQALSCLDHGKAGAPKAAPRVTYIAAAKPANEATNPRIKMVVSDWYNDGLGNQARIIKACD